MRNPRTAYLFSSIVFIVVIFSRCFHGSTAGNNDPRGPLYAGSQSCTSCHQPVFNSYIHNNHFKTSAKPDPRSLKLLTAAAKNPFYFLDSTHITVEEKHNTFFQTLSLAARSEKIDIAFGAAKKAQTYGYWKDAKLYQLPLTWFADGNAWANSPGFPASHARFDRVITTRCFECHASYVKRDIEESGPLAVSEKLDPNSIIYGIDCERCHGPALEHVRYQQDNPNVKTAKVITRIGSLTRQQQLDLCGICHSGNDRETQRSLFEFTPGDTLTHFYFPSFGETAHEPDVHGQQLQLLRLSKCFAGSQMTCSTCHETHNAQQTTATYVARCFSCHENSAHAVAVMQENEQRKRDFNLSSTTCVDCHMPLLPSKMITLNNGSGAKTLSYFLRTHKIAVYK
jgi:hypothetical protein